MTVIIVYSHENIIHTYMHIKNGVILHKPIPLVSLQPKSSDRGSLPLINQKAAAQDVVRLLVLTTVKL